jgi:hypothetical protein
MTTRLEEVHTSPPRILFIIEGDESAGLGLRDDTGAQ